MLNFGNPYTITGLDIVGWVDKSMPKEVSIDVGDSLSGPWRTIRAVQPRASCDPDQARACIRIIRNHPHCLIAHISWTATQTRSASSSPGSMQRHRCAACLHYYYQHHLTRPDPSSGGSWLFAITALHRHALHFYWPIASFVV